MVLEGLHAHAAGRAGGVYAATTIAMAAEVHEESIGVGLTPVKYLIASYSLAVLVAFGCRP